MLLSPWYYVEQYLLKTNKKMLTNYNPKVSVLIPSWNEQDGVITTVKGLLASTYNNLEIIIINNNSTDKTEKNCLELIKNYKKTNHQKNVSVHYYLEKTQGKGHALNTGIKKATGDILVSIDADCFVDPRCIENFVKHFRDPKVMASVGNVKIGNTDTLIGVIQYLEFLFSFYFKKADSLTNSIYIIGGAAGAFRKEVFEKIGNYKSSNITEDIELTVRIQDAGMKIVFANDALVYTEGATTLKGLMKQRLRWKKGRFQTFLEHKHLFFSRKKEHNKILTWIILPLAIFGELQLSLELIFLLFLYVFSYFTNDYSSFISGIIVVGSMFFVQVAFDQHKFKKLNFILLAPIGWLLFYVSTYVELNALISAIHSQITGKEVKWQSWKREGVFSSK